MSASPHVIDLRAEPVILKPGKWTALVRRDPSTMRGVVVHSWASAVGTSAQQRAALGGDQRLALAHRAREAGYGIGAGVDAQGRPLVVLAHPVERYTFTSDAGCRDLVSVGVFGVFPYDDRKRSRVRHTAITDALREAVDIALREAAAQIENDGPHLLLTHRQMCNGPRDHFACPGEAVAMMAAQSGAVADGLLVIDQDMLLDAKHSKSWPEHWRRHIKPSARDLVSQVCTEGLEGLFASGQSQGLASDLALAGLGIKGHVMGEAVDLDARDGRGAQRNA